MVKRVSDEVDLTLGFNVQLWGKSDSPHVVASLDIQAAHGNPLVGTSVGPGPFENIESLLPVITALLINLGLLYVTEYTGNLDDAPDNIKEVYRGIRKAACKFHDALVKLGAVKPNDSDEFVKTRDTRDVSMVDVIESFNKDCEV